MDTVDDTTVIYLDIILRLKVTNFIFIYVLINMNIRGDDGFVNTSVSYARGAMI
jgi:hypothetical protein